MSHYVVGYHDLQNNHYEICEYADDAYNAIKQAREDLPNMLASPLSCEYCIKEDWMKNLPITSTLVIFATIGTALWFYPQYAWATPILLWKNLTHGY